MAAYYNEIDPFNVAWLKALIKSGAIADGEVDGRDIRDVTATDLRGFSQHHFFAGIGIWSYALRLAGWSDDRETWTGSCPCQPFSIAGKGNGDSDERHLWPAWQWLIKQHRPNVVFGEQVETAVGHGWLDLVSTDLEGEGYAIGPVVFPACGIGAPHVRKRQWFLAHTDGGNSGAKRKQLRGKQRLVSKNGSAQPLAVDSSRGRGIIRSSLESSDIRHLDGRVDPSGELEHADSERHSRPTEGAETPGRHVSATAGDVGSAGPVNGHWRSADWLYCRDDRWRPVEPGTFPLAHGAPARVGRLRGYGNGIVAQAAAEMIAASMEYLEQIK